MQVFVDTMLHQMTGARSNADIEGLLGELADQLNYRSAFMLDFPADHAEPVRLWDSDPKRSAWWHKLTLGGARSTSRSLGQLLAEDGVQHFEVAADDPRHGLARLHDFASTTVVPVTFDHETRGVIALCGEPDDLAEIAISLQIVCYVLLMQARTIVMPATTGDVVLTPREREVMKLSAEGMTSEMVGTELGMAPRTVNQHIDNISGKLKTRNRVHTVAEALRRGLLA
jgi:DNA-binding CsgD family transcriptional regulator